MVNTLTTPAKPDATLQPSAVDVRKLAEGLLQRMPEQLIDLVVQQAQRIAEQQQQLIALKQQVCRL